MQNDCFPDAPVEWGRHPISVLAHLNPRYAVRKGEELPFVEMAAIGEQFGGILRFDTRKLEGSGLARFKCHDTLFAKITPCPENGKVAFVRALPAPFGIGSTELIVLSPKEECDPKFLYHLACHHAVRGRAASRMEGSTGRQRIPDDVFEKRLLVPKPTIVEHAAIARVLDHVDDTMREVERAIAAVDELRSAIVQRFFYEALGETAYADRPLKSLPPDWFLEETRRLLDGDPKNGVSPETSVQPPGVPTFSIGAIRRGRVLLETDEHLKFAHVSDRVADNFRLRRGDVLVVRGNANPNLVGRAGIVDSFPPGCIYPDIVKRLVFRRDGERVVGDRFAVIAWNHSIVHNQILRRAKTSNGTLKINNRDVQQIVMPVPPPSVQQKFVNIVLEATRSEDSLRDKLKALRSTKQALAGELLSGAIRVASLFRQKVVGLA